MPTFLIFPILVAEGDRTRDVLDAFRSPLNDSISKETCLVLLIAAAIAALLTSLWVVVRRCWWGWMASSPRALFYEICHAHHLTVLQSRLLWSLAHSQNLPEPSALFLKPECFEIGRLTVDMRLYGEELQKLRDRIFAEIIEESKVVVISENNLRKMKEKSNTELPLPPSPPTLDLPQWNSNSGINVGE